MAQVHRLLTGALVMSGVLLFAVVLLPGAAEAVPFGMSLQHSMRFEILQTILSQLRMSSRRKSHGGDISLQGVGAVEACFSKASFTFQLVSPYVLLAFVPKLPYADAITISYFCKFVAAHSTGSHFAMQSILE